MGRSVGWFSLPSWRCCCSVALLCSTLLMPYKTALMRLMLSDSPFQSKSITSILDLYSLASRSILCKAYSSYSKKEIAYETEFDMRPTISYPHDFPQWDYETLSVRIPGFNKIDHFESDGTLKGTEFIKNWELFAIRCSASQNTSANVTSYLLITDYYELLCFSGIGMKHGCHFQSAR